MNLNLIQILKEHSFYKSEEIRQKGKAIKLLFADEFSNGNLRKAAYDLSYHDMSATTLETVLMSLFGGVSIISVMFIAWVMSINDEKIGKI